MAIEEALDKIISVLTQSMKKGPENLIFHSEWDNHDVFCQEFKVGRPSIHTTAGKMFQEITIINDPPPATELTPTVRNKNRNFVRKRKPVSDLFPSAYLNKKDHVGPVLSIPTQLQVHPTSYKENFNQAVM